MKTIVNIAGKVLFCYLVIIVLNVIPVQDHINKHENFLDKHLQLVDDDVRSRGEDGDRGDAGEGGEEYQTDPEQYQLT